MDINLLLILSGILISLIGLVVVMIRWRTAKTNLKVAKTNLEAAKINREVAKYGATSELVPSDSASQDGVVDAQGGRVTDPRALEALAQQGDADAQFMLGEIYLAGKGIPQHYVYAHMWFNIAASSGDKDALEMRGMVEARMTPSQLEEAQDLAREWLANHAKVPSDD